MRNSTIIPVGGGPIPIGPRGSVLIPVANSAVTRLVFDQTISNPANITGYGQGAILDIIAKMRRCLCKKTAEGEVAICYLDNNNSNYYYDGVTPAVLTGGEGDVMVYMPDKYYEITPSDGRYWGCDLSQRALGVNTIFSPKSLLGAYKSNVIDGNMYSQSGVLPTGSISQANSIAYAKARGTGYNIIDFDQHSMIAMLFYAKYGTRDSQGVLGGGSIIQTTANGSTNALGNADTVKATSGHASFAGIEGVHGVVYEWISGIDINNYVWTATDPDGTTRPIGTAPTASGVYITEIAAANGKYFDLMPIAVSGGSSSTYYADVYYCSTGSRVFARSGYSSSTNGGVSYADAHYDSSNTYTNIVSRLAFRGTIVEEKDIQAFKNLPIL